MSHLSLSNSNRSTFGRKRNENGISPQQNKPRKKTRIAFDVKSMDATYYLSQVTREAQGISDIVVSDSNLPRAKKNSTNQSGGGVSLCQDLTLAPSQRKYVPVDGSAASLSYLLSSRASVTPPPSTFHLPKTENMKEWTTSVVFNFDRLRGYLERSEARGFGGKLTIRKPLPAMKDRPSWHIFCVGADDASGNFGAYFANDYDNNNIVENTEEKNINGDKKIVELPSWMTNLPTDGYEPSVSLLLQMDQVMIRRVLSHLTFYINRGWSTTSGTGRRAEWVYALLARLEKPLHRDDAAELFGLLKNLTLARSKIDLSRDEKDRNVLSKLNVLIVIVGVYFEQGGSLNKFMACK